MKLPGELQNIIMDYYWSHWVYERRQLIHQQLHHIHMLEEVKLFYRIFYSPLNPYPGAYVLAMQGPL